MITSRIYIFESNIHLWKIKYIIATRCIFII